jgi:hypothetical protein
MFGYNQAELTPLLDLLPYFSRNKLYVTTDTKQLVKVEYASGDAVASATYSNFNATDVPAAPAATLDIATMVPTPKL